MTTLQKKGMAENVRRVRLRIGFQQVEFAALLGVHPITVSKWETARAVPSPWQWAIIEAVGTSPRDRDIMQCYCSRGIAAALSIALEHLNR